MGIRGNTDLLSLVIILGIIGSIFIAGTFIWKEYEYQVALRKAAIQDRHRVNQLRESELNQGFDSEEVIVQSLVYERALRNSSIRNQMSLIDYDVRVRFCQQDEECVKFFKGNESCLYEDDAINKKFEDIYEPERGLFKICDLITAPKEVEAVVCENHQCVLKFVE